MRKSSFAGRSACISLAFVSALVIFIGGSSCNKEVSSGGAALTSSSGNQSTSSIIAVAVAPGSTDSIYILQTCARGYFRDSIPSDSLPATITAYVDSNYHSATYLKQFIIKDSAGAVGGYLVIISYNNKPVALLFNGSGQIWQVLEQRQPGDMNGPGWHHGGRYQNRDGQQHDTIAGSALPSNISAYMTTNYPGDTLIRAYRNIDSSILVISQDNGLFATVFSSSGAFIRRVELPAPSGLVQSVPQSALPASAPTYLTTTYPNYVFDKAFSLTINHGVVGYEVIIDANNTKYGVVFDGSGNYVASRIIW